MRYINRLFTYLLTYLLAVYATARNDMMTRRQTRSTGAICARDRKTKRRRQKPYKLSIIR